MTATTCCGATGYRAPGGGRNEKRPMYSQVPIWTKNNVMPPREDWWVVLGVDRNAPRKTVNTLYYKLIRVEWGKDWNRPVSECLQARRLDMALENFIKERSAIKERGKKPAKATHLTEKRLIW